MHIIIVTGLSGAGKSTAISAYEDRGFFCVDNLPLVMIPGLIESATSPGVDMETVVLGIDVRERNFLPQFSHVAKTVRQAGHDIQLIFLEARRDVLIRRFSETRRTHPLVGVDIRLALEQEVDLLSDLREQATHVIDTSELTVHDLKRRIGELIGQVGIDSRLILTLLSFGFKYGVPTEADLVFDVRFLPNPYFVKELRPLTGLDAPVYDYVMGQEESGVFLEKLQDMLSYTLPLYEKEGKAYLTVAVGCTGGRHRSISMVRSLEAYIQEKLPRYEVIMRHRDKDRAGKP